MKLLNIITNVSFLGSGESIVDARRAGDAYKPMGIISETMKLIGDSLYGRCAMKKEIHESMFYTSEETN